MQCQQCHQNNREQAKFCEGCGTRLTAKCAACSTELGPGARFCSACGTPVAGPLPAVAPPAALQSAVHVVGPALPPQIHTTTAE